MGRSLRYFSQRKNPINICGNRILMFRTKSFAKIAAVFLYSRSSGKDKEKGQEKIVLSPGLFLCPYHLTLNTEKLLRYLRTISCETSKPNTYIC